MDKMFSRYISRKAEETSCGIEIFGTRISVVNGMIRLNDVRAAYLVGAGEDPRTSTLKRMDKWAKNQDTIELIDYIEINYPQMEVVKNVEGRSGGTYACREVAHAFAMWLDPRYAYHVLKSFDQLIRSDLQGAWGTAHKVCKEIQVQEWRARKERIEQSMPDVDPMEVLGMQMRFMAMEIGGVREIDDVNDFRDYIFKEMRGTLIFERVLNVLEFAWKCDLNDVEPEEIVADHFSTDPEYPVLAKAVQKYFE